MKLALLLLALVGLVGVTFAQVSKTLVYNAPSDTFLNLVALNGLNGNVEIQESSENGGDVVATVVLKGTQEQLDQVDVQWAQDQSSSSIGLGIRWIEPVPPTNPPTGAPTEDPGVDSSSNRVYSWGTYGIASWTAFLTTFGMRFNLVPFAHASLPNGLSASVSIKVPSKDNNGKAIDLTFALDAIDGNITLPSTFSNKPSLSCGYSSAVYSQDEKIPLPQGGGRCPGCCNGNGQCTINGCVCNSGFIGNGCDVPIPDYLVNAVGAPLPPYKISRVVEKNDRRYVVFSETSSRGLYYQIKGNNTWFKVGGDNINDIILSSNQNNLIGVSSNRVFYINETSNSVQSIDISSGFDAYVLSSTLIAVIKGTTNPNIYRLNPDTLVWSNTSFPFTGLDGKPHVRFVIGDNNVLYYESNYSGTFRLLNGVWGKVVDEIAPYCFNIENSNPRVNSVQLSSSPAKITSNGWSFVGLGLPSNYRSFGIVERDGFLFMAVTNSPLDGIYQFNGVRWIHRIYPASQYGTGSLIKVGNEIYASGHNSLWRLVLAEKDPVNKKTVWVNTGKFLSTEGKGFQIFSGKNSIYFYDDNTNPQIYELSIDENDPNVGTFKNLNFPFKNLDGKPHINVFEDQQKNVWYESNYSGIFKYFRSNQTWVLVNNRSGDLSFGADGSIYLSYEITPTTQISTFFKYSEDQGFPKWTQIHSDSGYSISCYPLAKGPVFCVGNRFPEFVIFGSKKWNMPGIEDGLALTTQEQISQNCQSIVTTSDTIYCDHRYSKGGFNYRRVIALKPDLTGGYYDSNLDITTGTYLCSSPGVARDVKVLSNGNILASFDCNGTVSLGKVSVTPLFGSNPQVDSGRLVLLNPNATTILSAYSVGKSILDLSVSPSSQNEIVLATYEGLYKMDISSGKIIWQFDYTSSKKRVSFSNSHIAALLDENFISVFNQQTGSMLWNKTLGRSYTEDIAVHSGKGLVIAVGFDNKKLPSNLPVQVAFVDAFSITTGSLVWRRFSFDGNDLSSNIADTRLYHANIGQDGKLYLLGESAGSETIFRYNGTVFSGKESLTVIDFYNALWNTKSPHISYQARMDIETGNIEGSQLTMARLPSGDSNTFRAGDITGDQNGNLYVVGNCAAFYANRPASSINGVPVGQYNGDPVFLNVRPDFRNRNTWVSFIRNKMNVNNKFNRGGSMVAVDVGQNYAVVMGNILAGGDGAITDNAMISSNDLPVVETSQDSLVYLAVIPVRK